MLNERRIIDLFAGLGGFSLAAHWNGVEPAVQVEINPHCRGFLARVWPNTAQWGDINTFLEVCQEYVHIAGSGRFLRVTPLASRAIQSVSDDGGKEIESIIGPSSDNAINGKDSKFSLIMAASALAAGNPLLSFLHWITSTTTETRKEKPLFASRLGGSPSSEDFQKTITKCSVSTATTHDLSTEYVLIKLWLLAGGPPCQPSSRAGQQAGQRDNRWLWPQTIRAAHLFNPTWLCLENPPGILDVGLDGILADLAGLGYEVQPLSIPACAVDSPQDRERIWILGHRQECERGLPIRPERREVDELARPTQDIAVANGAGGGQPMRGSAPGQPGLGLLSPQDQSVADSDGNGHNRTETHATITGSDGANIGIPERNTWSYFEWLTCPDPKRGTVLRRAPVGLHDVADGLQLELPKGVCGKLLEALGNSIVPQVASEIIQAMILSETAD